MANKRSMSEALQLTQLTKEQLEYIRPGLSEATVSSGSAKLNEGETIPPSKLKPVSSKDVEDAADAKLQKRPIRHRTKEQGTPDPADILAKMRHPFSTTLPRSTILILKRFCFDQDQIEGELKEQQLVVDLALCEFFKTRGYLE